MNTTLPLPLFASEPRPRTRIARLVDPEPSKTAAREITTSGERDRQARIVLDAVKRRPGATSAELSYYCTIDRYVVARRLPELAAIGMVRRGVARTCTVSNRQAITWNPI